MPAAWGQQQIDSTVIDGPGTQAGRTMLKRRAQGCGIKRCYRLGGLTNGRSRSRISAAPAWRAPMTELNHNGPRWGR